jgi:hypothetical protein
MTRQQRAVHAALWPLLAMVLVVIVAGGFAVRVQTGEAIAAARHVAEKR